MFYYVVTPTNNLVYHDNELNLFDAAKKTTFDVRVAAFQTWLNNNFSTKISTLSGVALIAYNTVIAALKTAAKNAILTHVVARRLNVGVPNLINLSTATYIAIWDGISPYVTTVLGTFPGSISFMGWPQTDVMPDPPDPPTQAQIDAAMAAAAAKQAAQNQWRLDAQAQMQLGIPAYQTWVASNPYPT
jgi:hypothetical protein